jgi:hypothetical protein
MWVPCEINIKREHVGEYGSPDGNAKVTEYTFYKKHNTRKRKIVRFHFAEDKNGIVPENLIYSSDIFSKLWKGYWITRNTRIFKNKKIEITWL